MSDYRNGHGSFGLDDCSQRFQIQRHEVTEHVGTFAPGDVVFMVWDEEVGTVVGYSADMRVAYGDRDARNGMTFGSGSTVSAV